MEIPLAELEAAGLYDPNAPDAAERLVLIEWLVERGATLDHMARSARTGSLLDVAADLGRRRGPNLTLREAAQRAGIPVERIQAIRFAAGLPALAPDAPGIPEAAARSFQVFAEGERLFGREAVRRFTQVLGATLSRAAEAAIAVSLANLAAPIVARGGSALEIAKARYASAQTGLPLAAAVSEIFLAHLEDAGRRLVADVRDPLRATTRVAVGFVDLVGFTPLARRLDAAALGALIDRFEETAHDVTLGRGGRVVKFIGDEVMFVTSDATAACDVAIALVEHFAHDESVTPRGGIAAGDVLVRGGDYHGPIVNLAARMAELAVPGEVLVTEDVATEADTRMLRCEPAGRRALKGFDEPVRLLTVVRAAPHAGP